MTQRSSSASGWRWTGATSCKKTSPTSRMSATSADEDEDATWDDDGGPRSVADLAVPFVRETPKVGRNEPCPCGSGKKYKRCCEGK